MTASDSQKYQDVADRIVAELLVDPALMALTTITLTEDILQRYEIPHLFAYRAVATARLYA